jgi:rhomboid-like protein
MSYQFQNNNSQLGFPPFTPVVKNLIIFNFLVWAAQSFISPRVTAGIENLFALHSTYSALFRPWQLFTYMFLHSPFGSSLGIMHILFNMLGLWMFGTALEMQFGQRRFLFFYFVSGVGAAVIYLTYMHFQLHSVADELNLLLQSDSPQQGLAMRDYETINAAMLGASGAIFGILAAFAYLFPNTYLYLYFFLPIKTKWAVIAYLAIELYLTIKNTAGDNVAHVAHLGGALVGFAIVYIWNKTDRKHFY